MKNKNNNNNRRGFRGRSHYRRSSSQVALAGSGAVRKVFSLWHVVEVSLSAGLPCSSDPAEPVEAMFELPVCYFSKSEAEQAARQLKLYHPRNDYFVSESIFSDYPALVPVVEF